MRRVAIVSLLCLAMILMGCGPLAGTPTVPPTPSPQFIEPTATPAPSPTPTATPIPSPTPTPTRTPTPTATPTPTPRPLVGALLVNPAQVRPGHTLLVRLLSSVPATATATLDDQVLLLFPEEVATQHAAVFGITIWAQSGRHVIRASLRDALGRSATVTSTVEVLPADYPVEDIYLPPGREQYLDPKLLEDEWAKVAPVLETITAERLWAGPFVTPTNGVISSLYGTMRSYNGGPPDSYHNGLDIANLVGTPVKAPARGRVVFAEKLQARGNAIIIDHGWGVHSSFFHLSAIEVQVGDLVEAGQLIGRIGATGLVTGPHLHWELRLGMVTVDPLEWTRRAFP